MKDDITFWKKYGIKIILFIVVVFFVTYFFFTKSGYLPTGIDLEKSDWLGFWAGFLSFVGSLFLGAVALWQNERATEVNKKLLHTQIITSQATFIRKYDTLKIIKSKRNCLESFEIENAFSLSSKENNHASLYFELKINNNGYTGDVPVAFRTTFLNIDPGEDDSSMKKSMHMKFTKAYFESFFYDAEDININFSVLYSESDMDEVTDLLSCQTPSLMLELEYLNAYHVLTTQTLFIDTKKLDDENYKILKTSILATEFSVKEKINEQ